MVLLYDPDPDYARLFRFLLEYLGYTVYVAASLDDAQTIAAKQAPRLIIVRSSASNEGWAVCRALRTLIDVPVLGLLPERPAELEDGLEFLPLPVDPAALRALVQVDVAVALA